MINVQLKDRLLWIDGSISVSPEKVTDYLKYPSVFVTETNDEVEKYNEISPTQLEIKRSVDVTKFDFNYNIPTKFAHLDVDAYVYEKLLEEIDREKLSHLAVEMRVIRVKAELEEYNKRTLYPLLRSLIYVINSLTQHSVPWGVGRGSSVSSYILYLIGIHDVDSVAYDLDASEFLK